MDGPQTANTSVSEIEGETPQAMPVEGAARAPIIAEAWMQSEPCCPRIIMGTPLRRQSCERSVPTHPTSEAVRRRGRAPTRA
jgi:hypothetical protein